MRANRLTIPGKIIDLLFNDTEFFREVLRVKKADSGSFPRYDQWFDEEGLHMQFALAGYSASDISIDINKDSRELTIQSQGLEPPPPAKIELGEPAKNEMQAGILSRGIARRKFRTKFFLSPSLNLNNINAAMVNGLLNVVISTGGENGSFPIDVKE